MRRTFFLFALAILASNAILAQQPARKAATSSAVQSDLRPAYQKWVTEDVAYIMTAEEKRAFLMLRSDDEREQFISEFWRRRDTDRTTGENEFRADYYRRIAYANENFGFGEIPGWHTDRGRIYITHGKPDEVRKTTSGEVWVYRYSPEAKAQIEVEFVNMNGTGDYRLRLPNP